MKTTKELYKGYLRKRTEDELKLLANNFDEIETIKHLCEKRGIASEDIKFYAIRSIGVIAEYPNILELLIPEIEIDKEGLIEVKQLERYFKKGNFQPGYFHSEKFIVMANILFRRGYNIRGCYTPRMIEKLFEINDSQIQDFLSIDLDRIKVNVKGMVPMELDTWYGASFKEEISEIKDGVVKLKPPPSLDEFDIELFFDNTYSLDVKWETKGKIKSFQSKEFKTEKVIYSKNGLPTFPVKYIHAEYNCETKHFRHFDGAIHFYNEDEYRIRRDSDFNYNYKCKNQMKPMAEKLFKLNGVIKKDMMLELTSQFYSGNPLIFEYFEGMLPDRIIKLANRKAQ